MDKTIALSGGPEDGMTTTIPEEKHRYYVIRAMIPGVFAIGMDKGTYLTTGEFSGNNELFTWQGWDSEKK